MPNYEKKDKGDYGSGKPQFPPSTDMAKIAQSHEKAIAKATEQKSAPPRIVVAQCHVCKSKYRDWIESLLIKGHSYLGISRSMEHLSEEERVDRRSISRHVANGHMAVTEAAYRAIIEEEANLDGKNFEEGVRGALTMRGILELMAHKGFEDILNDITTVEPKDLIQIVKLKMEMDAKYQQVQVDEYRRQAEILARAIQEVIPPALQGDLVAKIRQLKRELGEESDVEAYVRPEIESTANEL
jgi:hypothetical protein